MSVRTSFANMIFAWGANLDCLQTCMLDQHCSFRNCVSIVQSSLTTTPSRQQSCLVASLVTKKASKTPFASGMLISWQLSAGIDNMPRWSWWRRTGVGVEKEAKNTAARYAMQSTGLYFASNSHQEIQCCEMMLRLILLRTCRCILCKAELDARTSWACHKS